VSHGNLRILAGVLAVVAFLHPVAASAQATSSRVGYVDVQRILARSSAGVAAREQLEKEKATLQKNIDAKRTEIEKLREELEKKGALLSADVRREKQDVLERQVRDLRRLADDYQKELEKKEADLLQKVLQGVSGIIDRIGKQKGYHVILDRRAGIIYGSPEADLTDEIIKAYDLEAAKGKKK
jgi:outer membrane protein